MGGALPLVPSASRAPDRPTQLPLAHLKGKPSLSLLLLFILLLSILFPFLTLLAVLLLLRIRPAPAPRVMPRTVMRRRVEKFCVTKCFSMASSA